MAHSAPYACAKDGDLSRVCREIIWARLYKFVHIVQYVACGGCGAILKGTKATNRKGLAMDKMQKLFIANMLEAAADIEANALRSGDIGKAHETQRFVDGMLIVLAALGYSIKFDDNGNCTLVAEATDDKEGN